eukprot:TRINITY_DN17189_c0_g1_i6.p1 TRINITY_DN17189_c0_g1~~TRINITY_DN17189_c0_g1_i6.p1  ORF type:complete len:249 (+),score=76.27 TRINITY_DN17189_c0_g1_i6:150-896(+)
MCIRDRIDTDHELNIVGIKQASALNARWKAANPEDFPDPIKSQMELFQSATKVVSSPLTRAVQTALVSLWEHPALDRGLSLSRLIREQKNAGGFDTVGDKCGHDISVKVAECMAEEFAKEKVSGDLDGKKQAGQYMVPIDPGDACSDWWTKLNDKDAASQVKQRLDDFLGGVYLRQEHGTIFVGHSLFFKAMMQHFTGAKLETKNKKLYDSLNSCKLANAGCAAVTVDFSHSEPEIVDVSLLYDTTLH